MLKSELVAALCFYGKLYLYGLVDAVWELVEALLGSYTHYAISYRELVHVTGGCWRLYGSFKGAMEDVKGQDEAVRV